MATAFNTSALSGDFSLAFKEFGNGFKNSVVGMAADLMTELQKGFLKKLAMSVIDAFSGGGGGLSQIIGGIGSSLSGGLGGVVGGVGGALGSVGGLLGSAGGALAGGASAVGGAAMGAIGAIGASTLGIGLLVGGAALAIHEMTGGKKSEGTKIRDMIRRADNPAERLAGFLAIENDLANASIASTIMGTARMWSQKKTWGDGSPVRQEQAEKRAYDDAVRELSSARHGNLPNDVITRGAETARRAVEMFFALSEAESSELMAFQKGGIIPGILGSPRLIIGHAGEEVVTRQDPRHSINFGSGLTVYITGNYINSDIDIKMLARRAGEGIMKELKVMQLVATS